MSLRFAPSSVLVNRSSAQMHKVASWTSPLVVQTNGSKHIHYVSDLGVRWETPSDKTVALSVSSLDAGLLAVGEDSRPVPTLFSRKNNPDGKLMPCKATAQPDLEYGVSV